MHAYNIFNYYVENVRSIISTQTINRKGYVCIHTVQVLVAINYNNIIIIMLSIQYIVIVNTQLLMFQSVIFGYASSTAAW